MQPFHRGRIRSGLFVAGLAAVLLTAPVRSQTALTNVPVGTEPNAVAVNPVTNKIYVANYNSNNVTVIDGATNATTTVAAGTGPWAVAVNPVTDKIYVANYYSANVTVIDGATNATTTVAAGTRPSGVAVNPVTNKIYVTNYWSNNVTVIDGATNATTTVAAGARPQAVAVNPATDKIYVANRTSNDVTVIDGATNATTTVAAGANPSGVAVNPVTDKIYVTNYNSANVTVIASPPRPPVPLTTTIAPLPNHRSSTPTPTFSFQATSTFAPNAPAVQQIYYQVDTWTGPWLAASPTGGSGSGTVPPLQDGVHVLYAFATDAQAALSTHHSPNGTSLIGEITAYPFLVSTAASFQTLPHACGPMTISVTGSTTLGGTVQTAIAGQGQGLPFVGLGFPPSSPFCGTCTVGHSWSASVFGTSHTLQLPTAPTFLGVSIAIQGAGFLTPGGCAAPQFSLSDTVVLTIL